MYQIYHCIFSMLHVVSLSSSFSSSNTLDFDTPANLFYILNLFYFCLLLPIWLSFWLSLEHIIMLPRLATNNLVSVLTVKAKRTKINKFYIKKILYSVNTLMSQLSHQFTSLQLFARVLFVRLPLF